MSKICTNCGAQIADGAGFCPNCGTAAPPDTPAGGSRFCSNCGFPVNAGATGNLLVNGNASDGMTGWNAPDGFWTTDIDYDGVTALDSYYFCTKGFKVSGGSSRMYQDVNISAYAGRYASLSTDLRAFRSGHPDEMMGIEFLNAGGTVIESYETQKESGNSEWHLEGLTVTIPSGAVTARVSLYTFYKSGSESDAYYDNVSFTID